MRGVKRQSINELVKRSVILLTAEGKVDVAQADVAVGGLDPSRSKAQQAATAGAPAVPMVLDLQVPHPGSSTVASAGAKESQPGRPANAYQEARTLREQSEAALAQLELEKAYGSVVDREGVRRASVEVGRMMRDRLLPIGVQLAPALSAKTDVAEIGRLIEGEIRKALEDCVKLMLVRLDKQAQ